MKMSHLKETNHYAKILFLPIHYKLMYVVTVKSLVTSYIPWEYWLCVTFISSARHKVMTNGNWYFLVK